MSTPPGSRWSRAGSSVRGSSRQGARRGNRGRTPPRARSRPGATSALAQSRSFDPRDQPNNAHNGRGTSPHRRGAQVSSAVLSHAGAFSIPKDQPWRNAAEQDNASYKQRMSDLYQTLKEKREKERKQAMKDGFLADPDRPRSLANAITPVGTCQDMCPEFERVERIVQLMVDANEKIPSTSDPRSKVPSEELMVKRFRRSAAGYDEQLPSDIRPPLVLQKTLNHLFETVIGGPEPLANIHKFVWDRTRGIRNDFSIQQVTKIEDLKIAIECFERIARFHILSLHQLSHPTRDNGEFDHYQEREQLNNTLLSLVYYYDDSRHQLASPNEAEFRAYCIIFEMQDQRPDVEDRAQSWPSRILNDPQVKIALKLYAAAGNTYDQQGPLRPRTSFSIAQMNTRGFFDLVQSNSVPYLMACVAEMFFNLVRSTAIETIWTAYRKKRPGSAAVEDWGLEDLTFALAFDYQDQTRIFCEEYGIEIGEREHGEDYVNLGTVAGRTLTDHNPRRKQIFSKYVVESKRRGRTYRALIEGLSFLDAKAQGLIKDPETDSISSANSEPLFITGDSDGEQNQQRPKSGSPSFDTPPPSQVMSAFEPNSTATTFGSVNPFRPNEPPNSEKNPPPITESSIFSALGSSGPPKFDFLRAAADAKKAKENKAEETRATDSDRTSSSSISFGMPSTPISTKAIPEPINNSSSSKDTSQPASFFSIPTSFPPKPPSPKPSSDPDQSRVPFGAQPESSESKPTSTQPEEILKPSITTSKLFQSVTKEQEKKPTSSSESNISLPAFTFQIPDSTDFAPESSLRTTFSTPTDAIKASTKQISNTANKAPLTTVPPASIFPLSETPHSLKSSQEQGAPNSSIGKIPPVPSFFPSSLTSNPQQLPQTITSSSTPEFNSTSIQPVASGPSETIPGAPKTRSSDPRSEVLDKVTVGLMLDDGGLLQQYIEISVGPIIDSAIARFENEESWKVAKEYRLVLLSKKYLRKWKSLAWNLGIMRRGRKQRQSFARSIQKLAESAKGREREVGRSSIFDPDRTRKTSHEPAAHERGFSSIAKSLSQKRQSLPTGVRTEMSGAIQPPRSTKRKLDDSEDLESWTTRSHVSGHQLSKTISSSINPDLSTSAPPHPYLQSESRRSVKMSNLANGSLSNHNTTNQARRIAPNMHTDTTQTDYFRLKALGINPETPIIPLTKRRAITSEEDREAFRTPERHERVDDRNHHSSKQRSNDETSKIDLSASKDDDDFFASIRAIRSTLADSTAWFQSERQSMERSIPPSRASESPSSSKKETPAQQKLREIREKGHAPSRSEIRLRAMGDRSLLPPSFWDSKRQEGNYRDGQTGKRKSDARDSEEETPRGKERRVSASGNAGIGFAALLNQPAPRNGEMNFAEFGNEWPQQNGLFNGFSQHGNAQAGQSQQNTGDIDEVIELSD